MNSFSEAQTHTYMPHGNPNVTPLLRIETDQGVEGVGVVSSGAFSPAVHAAMRKLIGANPLELYETSAGRITGRAPAHDALLHRTCGSTVPCST